MFNDEAVFHHVFEWSLNIFEGEFQAQLVDYHDVIGTLVMARIVNHQHLKMFNAKDNGFSDFFSRVEYKLWPHFSKLIRMQIDSVKNGKLSTAQLPMEQAGCFTRTSIV